MKARGPNTARRYRLNALRAYKISRPHLNRHRCPRWLDLTKQPILAVLTNDANVGPPAAIDPIEMIEQFATRIKLVLIETVEAITASSFRTLQTP